MNIRALGALALVAGLALTGTLYVVHQRTNGPLEFTITFKDAKQLRAGQFVVYNGVRIGEVRSVDLVAGRVEVQVGVDSKYRDSVYQEALYTIERPSFTDITGERQITVSDAGRSRTPVQRASVIQGNESTLPIVIERARRAVGGAVQEAIGKVVGSGSGAP